MSRAIVIVGAGPGGLAAARAYRECGGEGTVTMLGGEHEIPYRRPPLSKEFLRGELAAEKLPIEPPEWFAENEVELALGCEATAIDPRTGTVETGQRTLEADAIVLATGAEPVRPDLPGLDDERVLTLRERRDSELIAATISPGTHAVVIGTGFIGCELAASLALREADVTLVGQEQAPQEQRLGADAAVRIAGWLRELGVRLRMGAEVCGVVGGRRVLLGGGETLEAGAAILAMGVRPRAELAERAGLAVRDGAVLADERTRAHERVHAVGDVAFARNARAGRRLRVEHWGDALGQGEVAGRVLAGEDARWDAVPGFFSTIGSKTLKYAAWGDGHDRCRTEEHPGGAFTVSYERDGRLVGVLAHERDEDYERGRLSIAEQTR